MRIILLAICVLFASQAFASEDEPIENYFFEEMTGKAISSISPEKARALAVKDAISQCSAKVATRQELEVGNLSIVSVKDLPSQDSDHVATARIVCVGVTK
jgi:hypothetical protein